MLRTQGCELCYSLDWFDVALAPLEQARQVSNAGRAEREFGWFMMSLTLENGSVAAPAVKSGLFGRSIWKYTNKIIRLTLIRRGNQ